MTKRYDLNRDAQALGQTYCDHVMAMTAEGLHEKSDIAAELAWRDEQIKALAYRLDDLLKRMIVRDNGYDRCRLCGHQTHYGQEIPHDDYCPLIYKPVVEKL